MPGLLPASDPAAVPAIASAIPRNLVAKFFSLDLLCDVNTPLPPSYSASRRQKAVLFAKANIAAGTRITQQLIKKKLGLEIRIVPNRNLDKTTDFVSIPSMSNSFKLNSVMVDAGNEASPVQGSEPRSLARAGVRRPHGFSEGGLRF
jgi:hypothetical protein